MRAKKPTLVIAFHTTAEAMAMEKACKHDKGLGRMIPVPRQISAGCGLAWSAEPTKKAELQVILERENIQPEAVAELMI